MMELVKRLALRPEFVCDTPIDLSDLGAELLKQMPEDYRHFLHYVLKFKTLEVISIKCDFSEIIDEDGLAELGHLFTIFCETDSHDLRVNLDCYTGRIPEGFIPIGDNLWGDLFCLRLGKGHVGEVWFWPHDAEGPEDDPSLMTKIADNFTEFMRMLRVDNRYGFLSEETAKLGHELALAVPQAKLTSRITEPSAGRQYHD